MAFSRLNRRQTKKRLGRSDRFNQLSKQGAFKHNRVTKLQLKDLLETDQYETMVISEEEKQQLETQGMWTIVASSNVKAVRLIGTNLQIMFGDGSIYEWRDSEIHYNGILVAGSAGRYIHRHLYGMHSAKL